MSLSQELNELEALHRRGVLSDDELARAKRRLIDGVPGGDSGLGEAAHRYVTLQWVTWIVGVVFALVVMSLIHSERQAMSDRFDRSRSSFGTERPAWLRSDGELRAQRLRAAAADSGRGEGER